MVVLASEAVHAEPQAGQQSRIDWPLVMCTSGALLAAAVTSAAALHQRLEVYLGTPQQLLIGYAAFALAIILPVFACWRRAIADGQLPARKDAEPQYEHVNGWSAVFLFVVVAIIAFLVVWAANSDANNRRIHAEWGTWTVIGLSIAFVVVASAPVLPRLVRLLGLQTTTAKVVEIANEPIEAIGKALSAIDGVLVFAVANAVGTNRQNFFLRYAILLAYVCTCAALGYFWPPPWAFFPILYGFVIAFSVSRRWAWIEGDRELAMLNPTLSRAHVRVGFAQNLRDEALVAFLSMFLLVPLALRQGQILANDNAIELFTLQKGADFRDLNMWISFYGTELAKAVPFVDWAEVYNVGGASPVSAERPLALHAVFAVRVLIDLVFLAALLQAISSASRDAQQTDLFYKKRAIKRLDPFTEPETFRSLVRKSADGGWEANGEKFEEFPEYDADRLIELSADRDERVKRAADLLIERDDIGTDPHHRLSIQAADRQVTPEAISAVLDEIENAGSARNVYQLALARRRLLWKRSMLEVRKRIVKMITQNHDASDRPERRDALIEAMIGENKESYQQGRRIALDALEPDVGIDLRIRNAIAQVAAHDGAQALRNRAAEILSQHPETPD